MHKPVATTHLRHLDGLRALAAVYVLLCHAFLEVNFRGQALGNTTKFLLQFFFFGHYAIDLFIVLSGFCLMLPVLRNGGTLRGGAWRFLKRRAWRIIPPYYAALTLSLLLIAGCIHQKTGTHWDASLPVTGRSILTHLALVQDVFGDDANINHVLWSISVEWRIYFLLPLLVLAWSRFGAVAVTAVTLVLSYVGFQWCLRTFGNPLAAHYIGLFTLGMLGANIASPNDKTSHDLSRLRWPLITGFFTLVVVLLLLPHLWDGPHLHVYVVDYVVGVWSMSVLVTASRNEHGWTARFLGCKPLVFVGTFAYSVYLIHAPLLQVLWQGPFAPLQAQPLAMLAALTLLGTPLILGVAYVFFLAFERPFLRTGAGQPPTPLAVAAALQPAP